MKKRIVAIVLFLALAIGLTACGGTGKKASGKDYEQETWSDDTVISFTDKRDRQQVANITGIMSSDITYGAVKNIESLECWYGDLETLKYFTGLKKLKITGADSSTSFEPVGNLVNLEILEIEKGCASLENFDGLENLIKLKKLSIGHTYYGTDDSPLKNISELHIPDTLSKLKIIRICDMHNLENLSIEAKLKKLKVIDIDNCPKLVSFDIKDKVEEVEEFYIYSCKELEELDVSNLEYVAELEFSNCKKLKSLEGLENSGIEAISLKTNTLNNLEMFKNATNLTSLVIRCGGLTDISALGNLSNLKKLGIYVNQGGEENTITDISILENLIHLEELIISNYNGDDHASVGDAYAKGKIGDISVLEKLTNLKILNVGGTFEDISALSNLSNLEELALNGNFTDISPLSNLVKLRRLDINGNFTEENIVSSTINLTNLRLLDIVSTNPIDEDTLRGLYRDRGVDVYSGSLKVRIRQYDPSL